jgi:hypothetical protein
METPSNPGLKMVDIEKVAEIVRRRKDVLLAIDNTFLSPYFQVGFIQQRSKFKPPIEGFLSFDTLYDLLISESTEAIGIGSRYCDELGHQVP